MPDSNETDFIEAMRVLEAEALKGNDTTSERCSRILTAFRDAGDISLGDVTGVNDAERRAALALFDFAATCQKMPPVEQVVSPAAFGDSPGMKP